MADIAFVLPSFAGGGAERVAITLADRLRSRGFATSLLVLSAEGPLAAAVPSGLPLEVIGRSRLRSAAWPLIQRLRKRRPDLVVSTLPHVNLLLGVARPLLPRRTALLLRQSNMIARDGIPPGRRQALAHAFAYRNADAIVALTEAMRAELAGFSPRLAPLITVVPNPVDAATLRAGMNQDAPPRRATIELVASGRLVPQKNVAGLLAALSGVRADWHLTVLGDGPERAALRAQAAALGIAGRLSMVGFTDRPAAFVGAADAFLMASRWEGMPNAALEALACGTPVIGPADLPALAELAATSDRAVSLYGSVEEFRHLVDDVVPREAGAPRANLLPPRFEIDHAVTAFAAVAEAAIARRRGDGSHAIGRTRSAG